MIEVSGGGEDGPTTTNGHIPNPEHRDDPAPIDAEPDPAVQPRLHGAPPGWREFRAALDRFRRSIGR
jgi:hypothetical protein